MRIWTYLFFATALAATPQGGSGCDPCPTKSCDPGPGDTDGDPTNPDPPHGDVVDDPTLPNAFQIVQLDHSWIFDTPLLGTLEFEHHPTDNVLVLLDLTVERGAVAWVDDPLTSTLTGWPVGTEVELVGATLAAVDKRALNDRGDGVIEAGLPLELELMVTEPDTRTVRGTYLMKVPFDLPVSYDGRTLTFKAVEDGIGGVFTLR